jgi:murein DD-endopeptidase MepM/ murein hydrolase activator NlpD
MRVAILSLFIFLALPLHASQEVVPSSPAAPQEVKWLVEVQPERLVNGAPYRLRVAPPEKLESLSGTWLGCEVYLNLDPKSSDWYGLMGVSLSTAPGEYPLILTGKTASGDLLTFEQKFEVSAETYPVEELEVPTRFVRPNPRLVRRIKREMALKREYFSNTDTRKEWSGKFVPPVKTSISEVFGTGRSFNGELKRRHEGLDYRARPGTRVVAVNGGRVLLARRFFYEGNCVVIDHGQGLLTLYMHLSRLRVREGQRVRRGQLLGLSGSTGRATGPHLHFAVRWQGIYLDPARLFQLNLP